jgi:ribosomal protein S18 acetylase RimI-like enzyme
MKDIYRELCRYESSIPLFCRDWWLDAVYRENWNVLCALKDGRIAAALPYSLFRGPFGLTSVSMPKLTQYHGVWIHYPDDLDSYEKFLFELEVTDQIIDQLDQLKLAYFNQHFHYSFTNWLPFMWRGFQQTTRYTYVLEDLTDLEKVFARFKGDKRTEIRKAGKSLTIGYDLSAPAFFRLHASALSKTHHAIQYPADMLDAIFEKSYSLNQGKSIYCHDAQGKIKGAVFIVWDENSAYHFISAFDPEYRPLGTGSFLTWEAIKYVASRTGKFDFEGSIVENYERSYRGFGGTQKPYFNIRKTYSLLYLARDGLVQINRGLRQGMKTLLTGSGYFS